MARRIYTVVVSEVGSGFIGSAFDDETADTGVGRTAFTAAHDALARLMLARDEAARVVKGPDWFDDRAAKVVGADLSTCR